MIQYLSSSIFESPAQTLVNTVNTVGVMGKGIALGFKQVYPEMYERYRQLCKEGRLKIGLLFVYRTENKIVVNFPTKNHWRNPSQPRYIEAGLQKFVDSYSRFGISSVSFPQLGCGNGELDWESQVKPLMEHHLGTLPIPVFVHLYPKPSGFVPERLDAEFAREMRLARRRVSADQLWADLTSKVATRHSYQASTQIAEITADEEHLYFPSNGTEEIIYREDIEDLWSLLSLRRVMLAQDLARLSTLRNPDVIKSLFSLLSDLPYIKPIDVSREYSGKLVEGSGLQYLPEPSRQKGEIGAVIV